MTTTDPPRQLVTGEELGAKVCEVLGLDPNSTADISIRLSPNDAAQVQVTSWVWDDDAEIMVQALEDYRLVPAEGVDG